MGHDDDLMAARLTVDEIREQIGADSLALPVARRDDAGDRPAAQAASGYCNACFTGSYPIEVGEAPAQAGLRGGAGVMRVLVVGRRRGTREAGDRLGRAVAHGHDGRPASAIVSTCGHDARSSVDLVIVGPEAALVAGLADALRRRRHPVLRPDRRRSPGSRARRAFTRALAPAARPPVARVPPHATDPTTRSRGGASSAGRSW